MAGGPPGRGPLNLTDERLVKLIHGLERCEDEYVLCPPDELLLIARLAAVGKGIDPFPEDLRGD